MSLSFFSLVMSALFSTFFVLAIHLLRTKDFFVKAFGPHTILLLYGFTLFRMLLAWEPSFSTPLETYLVYTHLYRSVRDVTVAVGGFRFAFLDCVCVVWLSVSFILAVRFFWMNFTSVRKIVRSSTDGDSAAYQMLEIIKKEARRHPSVRVRICPGLEGPMGIGLIRKRIFLPDEPYTKQELYYILKHEYTHFCNHDLLIKYLVRLFASLFWWNPAVYLLKKDVSELIEIRCDMTVTKDFERKEQLAYLLTIVRILKGGQPPQEMPPHMLATRLLLNKERKILMERFDMVISKRRLVSKWCRGAFWALFFTLFFLSYCFILQPAYEPPREDIYTDSTVHEITDDEWELIIRDDGSYVLVVDDGKEFVIDEEYAQLILNQ
ncbi:MAG: M56 family metallopeptidase [Acutalibacter sp.]|nr:M56 family metallopeptidase [Acutalibacter sp.]